jgi:hypothetical protein
MVSHRGVGPLLDILNPMSVSSKPVRMYDCTKGIREFRIHPVARERGSSKKMKWMGEGERRLQKDLRRNLMDYGLRENILDRERMSSGIGVRVLNVISMTLRCALFVKT